jgi:glycopeptide antibiotics resistance protein
MQRDHLTMKYLHILAVAILVGLLLVTIVPASERPLTGLQHDIEHWVAFFIAGFCFALAFELPIPRTLSAAVAFTLSLECLQIPLASRHARFEDFIVDTIGICLGILIARFGKNLLPRLQT